jgi:hypothetical protein
MGSQSCEMREGGSQQNHKHTSRRGEFKEQGEAEEVRLYLLYLASLSLPPSMESMSQSIWRSALPRTASKSADLGSGTQCHRSSGCRHRCTQPQLVHTGESHSERVSPWCHLRGHPGLHEHRAFAWPFLATPLWHFPGNWFLCFQSPLTCLATIYLTKFAPGARQREGTLPPTINLYFSGPSSNLLSLKPGIHFSSMFLGGTLLFLLLIIPIYGIQHGVLIHVK